MNDAIIKRREEERRDLADSMLADITSGKSFSEIASSNGVHLNVAGDLLRKNFGKGYRQLREEAFKKALSRVETGELELFQLRDNFEFSPSSFYGKLCENEKRDLIYSNKEEDASPERLKLLYKSLERNGNRELDALLRAGLPLVEIGVFLGMNNRYVEHYMFGSGQHHIWHKKHEELLATAHKPKKLNVIRSGLLGILLHTIPHLKPENERLGYNAKEKAAQAIALTELRAGTRRLEKHPQLSALFHNYFEAEAKGEAPFIAELSKLAGYRHSTSAIKPLKNLGIPLLHKQHPLTPKEEELISRARKTQFSTTDIHYFAGISQDKSAVEKRMAKRSIPSRLAIDEGPTRINYSTASQVYEALDADYRISDLPSLLPGISEAEVNLILDNRPKIEPVIIAGLKTIYPRYKISRPYFYPGAKK
ncbi:MAG: hypothetical protein Q7R87_03545 [Nanoarchaeota archaeon]|nr:hypothetical protein [Nanoarchaeota archaeon]